MATRALGLVLAAAALPPAFAGSADSTGGIKVKSDDGRFEGALGGLLDYDYETFQKDTTTTGFSEGPFLRRAELILNGKAFDFKYKLAADLKGATPESKDMWLGTDLLGGFVKAGHMRPAYGMELLTSSADTLFTERPYVGNGALFAGREYQNGLSYDTHALEGLTAMVTVYSANTAADKSASATQSTTANGHGYAARLTWAPVMTESAVVHLGASYDDVQWASGSGVNAPAVNAPIVARNAPTLALIAAATYDQQRTPIAELATSLGPFFAQAEYAQAKYDTVAAPAQAVEAGYLQASVFVTGEHKPYKADRGVFGNPKPASVEYGALELKARYDFVKNDDAPAHPEVAITSAGLNYYFNANVRVMAEYAMGDAQTATTSDRPKAVVVRGQIAF